MSGIHQILLASGGGDLGTVFLEPNRFIQSEAVSDFELGFASASMNIQFQPSGIVFFNTFAEGDFTNQSGEGSYNWLEGGSASNYSLRYTTGPASPSGFSSNATANVWTPIDTGIVFFGSQQAIGGVGPVTNSSTFFINVEIALTADTSNILASGRIDVTLSATATGENNGGIPF